MTIQLDDTTALFVYNSFFIGPFVYILLFFLQNAGDKVQNEIQSPYQEVLQSSDLRFMAY